MSVLGLNLTDGDPAYGWADIHPPHANRPDDLIQTQAELDAALEALDELIDAGLSRAAESDESFSQQCAAAAERVRAAEAAYHAAWQRWDAEKARLLATETLETESIHAHHTHETSIPRRK